jgi:hypothetical protein
VFLFGAGASAFIGECFPRNPPLGIDLFRELQRAGGIASTVDNELARIFDQDFELGMAEFRRLREIETIAFLREMARYFVQFEPGPESHYCALVRIVANARRPSILATLNYDLLIESAISQQGLRVTYHGLPVPRQNIPVLKIHGSCNFLPDIAGRIRGASFDLSAAAPGSSAVNAPVRAAVNRSEVLEFCSREDSIAPAIALYAKGKQVLICPDFVRRQQDDWRREVKKASRLFVVGVRVNPEDSHIWESLRSSRGDLFYVGPHPNPFPDWAKTNGRPRAYRLANSFEGGLRLMQRELSRV